VSQKFVEKVNCTQPAFSEPARGGIKQPRAPGGVKEWVCHAERSEESAFISLNSNKCRFLASLGMTGRVELFTRSYALG